MSKISLGIIIGLFFGIIDVIIMIPLPENDKRKKKEAMAGAFVERFMIGFLIPNVDLGIHYALVGLILGLGLSLPSAIITRVYAPIIAIGAIGGILLGFISQTILL